MTQINRCSSISITQSLTRFPNNDNDNQDDAQMFKHTRFCYINNFSQQPSDTGEQKEKKNNRESNEKRVLEHNGR